MKSTPIPNANSMKEKIMAVNAVMPPEISGKKRFLRPDRVLWGSTIILNTTYTYNIVESD